MGKDSNFSIKIRHPRVAALMRTALAAKKISASRMAKDIGVSQSNLSRFLNGDADLDLKVINAIYEKLGVSPIEIQHPMLLLLSDQEVFEKEGNQISITIKI